MTDWTPPLRLFNEIEAADLNTYGRDNVNYLAENLPTHVSLWHSTSNVTAGNALARNTLPTQWYNRTWNQQASADADAFTQSFWCASGTATITILCRTTGSSGLVDWELDGVSIDTGMDFYSAAAAVNQTLTISSVSVATPGRHVLTATVNGKNGSSAGYDVEITMLWMDIA